MSRQVRVGVVGTSDWTDALYLKSLSAHPQAQLAAICGRNQERAAVVAAQYGIPQMYSDYRTMLVAGGLDAVVVATPDDLHCPITLAAIDAGLHVLCEKPLALNASDAHKMLERAERAGLTHMAMFTYRFLPHLTHMHNLIEQGYLGQLHSARLHFCGNYALGENYVWRFDRQRATGILGDLGSHLIDMVRWCSGEVVGVYAHLGQYAQWSAKSGIEQAANDSALVTLELASGAHASIHVSALPHIGERFMEQEVVFYGTAGTLEARLVMGGPASGWGLRGTRQGEEQFQEIALPAELIGEVDTNTPFMSHLFELFAQQPIGPRLFIDSILAGRKVTPSFHDGLHAQLVIDAALQSHRCGRRVALGEGQL